MARSKKKKNDDVIYYTEEELRDMTSDQKLHRVADLEKEIDGLRANLKDQAASTRDAIKEMEAKKTALLASVK